MRKLDWDSDFWGIDIFHLDVNENSEFELPNKKNFIVQSLCEISDVSSINMLERRGFSFKESKITLQKNKFDEVVMNNSDFQNLSKENLEPCENIYFELFGGNSRFDIFSKEKVNEFYYLWMINSIAGKMDDACIGYFSSNELSGFVTYRIRESEVEIGLLGVLPDFQGQGISQLLLNYVDEVAIKNNIQTVVISTQGTNINAVNAYIKNGYRIHSINHWYYYIKGAVK
ncbi:GNAT family N-acetyltransferase [Sporosarcina sp. ANT_H38]|uniref:GNAT family N-acetyltransferase n=1 Tax=Sporosarcina sp. ANT_H38 TaxID=2597358 RepID=UPI0011F3F128|nr:GNAT family N-acetyltransferase [Sporosarcina sp. ANT_H38]KAA0955533.1 GNAT family N-acetyltransferase [Sporosarcina sp. ANT_H38]